VPAYFLLRCGGVLLLVAADGERRAGVYCIHIQDIRLWEVCVGTSVEEGSDVYHRALLVRKEMLPCTSSMPFGLEEVTSVHDLTASWTSDCRVRASGEVIHFHKCRRSVTASSADRQPLRTEAPLLSPPRLARRKLYPHRSSSSCSDHNCPLVENTT